ncbi:hypothetical protein SAMN00120144_2167 [Hymenobacter roseosalivarius DSM 11622]|uniref:Glycosyltransferase RgtA/B/C/D-like domain-containing protein n=1 Tax=Hymenobacter roseosalivarius DSM 11622 TaxID=645990 RepID=A0A1W1UMF7_9BACT|nr:DUF6056 family protein [Hymenobacter roseosalivarius]SMB82325.1 hypothetical protein SAMN00120144_2167 [Hymenobacter roseosalivarius DSM 11622]
MRKALFYTYYSKRLSAIVIASIAVLTLLPFVALCWYAHPSGDDFLTANDVRKHGHWGYIAFMYMQWTGRYTAAALWGLANPVAYGNTTEDYGLVCLLILLLLLGASYVLFRALLGEHLKRKYSWLGSGVFVALFLLQMPSPAEGLYWIASAYNYLLPASLTLVLLAVLVHHASTPTQAARRKWLLISALLTVLVVGSNETISLPLLIWVLSFTALRYIQQRRLNWEHLFLCAVLIAACIVAFAAPGNYVRLNQATRYIGLLDCVHHAASAAYRCLIDWTGNGVLPAITLLLMPLGYRLSRIPDLPLNRVAQNPFFIGLLMVVSMVVVLTMGYSISNHLMPLRALNVLYLFFLVGWFLHAYAWARFMWQRFNWLPHSISTLIRWALVGWLFFGVFMTSQFRVRVNRQQNNVVVAYQDWLGGAAARYDAQLTARYKYLRASSLQEEIVEPLLNPPRSILFLDLGRNPKGWVNLAYAEFFGKASIQTSAK